MNSSKNEITEIKCINFFSQALLTISLTKVESSNEFKYKTMKVKEAAKYNVLIC